MPAVAYTKVFTNGKYQILDWVCQAVFYVPMSTPTKVLVLLGKVFVLFVLKTTKWSFVG